MLGPTPTANPLALALLAATRPRSAFNVPADTGTARAPEAQGGAVGPGETSVGGSVGQALGLSPGGGHVGPGPLPGAAGPNGRFQRGQVYERGPGNGGFTYLGGDRWRGAQGRVVDSVGHAPWAQRTQVGAPMQAGAGLSGVARQVSPGRSVGRGVSGITPAMTLAALIGRLR